VATCVSSCGVCVLSAAQLHGTQYTHHMLPQHLKTYNDVFLLINSTKV